MWWESCIICLHHSVFIPGSCIPCGGVIDYIVPQFSVVPKVIPVSVIPYFNNDTSNHYEMVTRVLNFVVQEVDAAAARDIPNDWIEIVAPVDLSLVAISIIPIELLIHSKSNEIRKGSDLIEVKDMSFIEEPTYIPFNQVLHRLFISTDTIQGCNVLLLRLLINENSEFAALQQPTSGYYIPSLPSFVVFEVIPNDDEFKRAQGFFVSAYNTQMLMYSHSQQQHVDDDISNRLDHTNYYANQLLNECRYCMESRGGTSSAVSVSVNDVSVNDISVNDTIDVVRDVTRVTDVNSVMTRSKSHATIHVMNVMGGDFDGQKKLMIQQWAQTAAATTTTTNTTANANANIVFSLLWVCTPVDSKQLDACYVHPNIVAATQAVNPPIKIQYLRPIAIKESLWSIGYVQYHQFDIVRFVVLLMVCLFASMFSQS